MTFHMPTIMPQFTSPLMRKRFRLMRRIVFREKRMMSLFTIFEIISLTFGISITLMLLIYFDAAPAMMKDSPLLGPLGAGKTITVGVGVILAMGSFLARLGQGYIDARVTSNREAWYAERFRALPDTNIARSVPSREVARGTHYYGRLTGATLHIVSSMAAFVLTIVVMMLVLPPIAKLGLLAALAISLPAVTLMGFLVAKKLKRSSVGLIARARTVALWKADRDIKTDHEVFEYFNMYFYRIFLVSLFGYMNLAFIAAFMILLFLNATFNFMTLSFGGVFFAYMAAQFYLGPLSRLVTNLVKIAAFLPFVEPLSDA